MSGNDKLERELESFLGDDSRVAALYRRLPKDEPDARLDAAILAKARSSVAPRRARPRWLPAMSAAAALVVVAGIAYRVGPQVWNEHSAVSGNAEQRVAAPASAPSKPAADEAPQPVPLNQAARPAESSSAPARRVAPMSGNAIPEQAHVQREPRADADKMRGELRESEEQKTTSSAFAAQSAQKTQAAGKDSARDNTRASSARPQASQTESEVRMTSGASPPRLDAAPAAAPPPPSMAMPAPSPASSQAASPKAFPAPIGGAVAPAAPAPTVRQKAAKPTRSTVDVEMNLYPEHWIADIHQMLKDGRRDDAIENLAAFRKRYPDYTLPDDLRDLK